MICIKYTRWLLTALLAIGGSAWAGETYYIDVRSAEEFQAGHVSVAHHIPYEQVADRIGEVTENRDAEIFLYCRSGRRADVALQALEALGYQIVTNLRTLDAARIHASQNADNSLIFD